MDEQLCLGAYCKLLHRHVNPGRIQRWTAVPRRDETPNIRLDLPMQRTLPPGGLTLRHFLLRAEVLSVYRQVIRSCRRIHDADTRRETIEWFKHDFRRNANITDPAVVRLQLAGIKRELKTMSSTFSLPTTN
ncbi:hypothetical protein RSAG8_01410, partial [Rhizoctonia solani AG-8 WAC10335]